MIDVRSPRERRADRTEVPTPSRHLQVITRWGATVLGVLPLSAGGVMLVLPGPGIAVVLAGLTVLATQFIWARRLLVVARRHADQALSLRVGAHQAALVGDDDEVCAVARPELHHHPVDVGLHGEG